MKQIYSSIDIGSDTIKLVVAEMYKEKLNVLACSEVKSKGIKNGLIINAEEVVICLKECFRRAEDVLNIKIDKVIAVVPSYYSSFTMGEGYTTITREDNTINGTDIIRALQSSVYNKIPDNKELVTVSPAEFIIDNNELDILLDPKGKKGNRLFTKSILSIVPKKNIYGVITLLEGIGIDVVDVCLGGTADFYEFKSNKTKDNIGAVINIGNDKSEVSIINKEIQISCEIIPLGGKHIDNDIRYIYNIDEKVAKHLKENFAMSSKRDASAREVEEVINLDGELVRINQYEISEIVHSRLKEMLELAKKQINLLTKKEISYIIITGGTTEIVDFGYVFENIFGKSYKISTVNEIGVRNNKYSSVLGSIKYYHDKLSFRNKISSTLSDEAQSELFTVKTNKINKNNVLGKVYGYFFDN